MKKVISCSFLTVCFVLAAFVGKAARVTPATGGSNILADNAANGPYPAWTTLGPITIQEKKKSDFNTGNNVTLVLLAPSGFEFNTAVSPDVAFTGGRDISSASATVVNSTTLRITFTVTGRNNSDTMTIGGVQGLQVRASKSFPLATGKIYRPSGASGGTASISGVRAGSPTKGNTTSFGTLTEVAGVAAKLGIQRQPSTNAIVGQAFGQQPIIITLDAGGNPFKADNGRVITASIISGPGTLSGNTNAVTVNGVATFTNLTLSTTGVVTLKFSSANLTPVTSASITVFPATPPPAVATSLKIKTQPSTVNTAGVKFAQQPVIMIVDQYDFAFTNQNSAIVTAANVDASDPLKGTLAIKVVKGVATFTNLFHTNATDLSIRFTSPNLNPVVSDVITINPGAASRLAFDTQPDLAGMDKPFGVQPVVITQDNFGNDSDLGLPSSLNVTMSLTSGTGALNGTTVLDIGTNDGDGIVIYTDLSIDALGNKQLTASASGLSNALSAIFDVQPKTNQTISSFTDIADKTYGDAPFTLTATASSGLPVNFTIVSGPATNSGSLVTITGAGKVVVRAEQSGNVDYFAAPSIDQEFNVAAKALTVTGDNATRNFGDANPSFTGTVSGIVNSDAITATYSSDADVNTLPGSYTIAITLNDPNGRLANYQVTQHEGTLTINSVPPVINTQPQGQTASQGTSVTLTVGATGPALSYQWRLNGTNVAGATTSALDFGSVQSSDAGTYSVVVTNISGSVVSSNAVLAVVVLPAIITQPTYFHVVAGANFTLPLTTNVGFKIVGAQPFTYHWLKDGVALPTQTNSTLRLPAAKAANSGEYQVVIANNAGGVTSAPITIIVGAAVAPKITVHPVSQDVIIADPVTFSVTAAGPVLHYQWYFNSQAISGATTSSYTLGSAQFTDSGEYSVVISNVIGTVTSSNALLSVNYDPNSLTNDVDFDGHTDVFLQSTNVSTNNFLAVWNMENTNFVSSFLLNGGVPLTPGWKMVGKGDFNHDNQIDYVFQNGGYISLWLMNGTNLINSVALNTKPLALAWKVIGTHDFNHDGNTDIILRHNAGPTTIWMMRGTKVLKAVAVRSFAPAYQLVGLDDFDKDGNEDLLWQHKTTGRLVITYMTRAKYKKAQILGTAPAPVTMWNIVGLVDIDKANSRDILWQNKTNNALMTWYMKGTNVLGTNTLNIAVPAGWGIVGER